MKKIIDSIKHHQDDYECMWNGIEDIYMNKTHESLPSQFFFAMSGLFGFVYLKTNKANVKRLVSFGEGRTRPMYEFLSPIVGFDYHFIENKTPEIALEKAKQEIDSGYPVIIGALDMYYLEYYPKLFHKDHIPFHYILMIGYDDELQKIYLYDNGKKEMVELSYKNLLLGMNAEYEGLSKKNTICTIRMGRPNSKEYILKTALGHKANLFVNPPTSFLGINGLRKLIKEIPDWENQLGKEETQKIFGDLIQFMGSVPTKPNRLLGVDRKDDVIFMCSRDKISKLFKELDAEYKNESFAKASDLSRKSGQEFEKLCNVWIDYILGLDDYKKKSVELLSNIADLEYDAFKLIQDGIEKLPA